MNDNVVYILEYDVYNIYGKYDSKNIIDRQKIYYDRSERQAFLDNWKRVVENDFHYDNIKAYGIRIKDSDELNLDEMINKL